MPSSGQQQLRQQRREVFTAIVGPASEGQGLHLPIPLWDIPSPEPRVTSLPFKGTTSPWYSTTAKRWWEAYEPRACTLALQERFTKAFPNESPPTTQDSGEGGEEQTPDNQQQVVELGGAPPLVATPGSEGLCTGEYWAVLPLTEEDLSPALRALLLALPALHPSMCIVVVALEESITRSTTSLAPDLLTRPQVSQPVSESVVSHSVSC